MQEPVIAEKPQLCVVGQECSFLHALSPVATSVEVIGPLWNRFVHRAAEVPQRADEAMYGVIYQRPARERAHPDELQYIAGVAVTAAENIPAGMVSRTIPPATFAVFLHRGPIQNIRQTVREIYRDWLPASPYVHAGVADVELYDHRFRLDAADSVMEYWVSVKLR